ncbi:hypothetical protein [Streptomyces sp. NPDC001880]
MPRLSPRSGGELHEHGKAVDAAGDPADSRTWILSALDGRAPQDTAPPGGRGPFVDNR